jgi:hypothetical protein
MKRKSSKMSGKDKRGSSHNAERERSRVRTLRAAFLDLQRRLPAVPDNTKLSKLDVLLLATTYIAHLSAALEAVRSGDFFKFMYSFLTIRYYLHLFIPLCFEAVRSGDFFLNLFMYLFFYELFDATCTYSFHCVLKLSLRSGDFFFM